ncbi:MAG: helix-turn-helix domain-containing protein [Coriobacteriia bacterium]|nr:helix-turn-helix domain-containing protein [Coriobacteriia bacterium]
MPRTREATVCIADLPDVATVAELAAFERVDERTLRAELDAGRVPGAYRRGRSWRIVTRSYLAAIGATVGEEVADDVQG